MTVRVNKSSFNIREKLSELERPIGLKGSELMRAETAQEARDFVSAGRKNLIINGDMRIAQRSTSSSTIIGNDYRSLDRWRIQFSGYTAVTGTTSQSSESPPGFNNSLRVNITGPEGLASGDLGTIRYYIEAQDCQQFAYGTSQAKTLTLSFWIRSSVTGTYTIGLYQDDDGRQVTLPYTIDTADTWEYKVITIPPDTTGVIDDDNGVGLQISWNFSAGSNYTGTDHTGWGVYANGRWANGQTADLLGVASNLYLTGVQLEVGKNATEFEHRSYGEELALCQRYFQSIFPDGVAPQNGYWSANNDLAAGWAGLTCFASSNTRSPKIFFNVPMRTQPTVTLYAASSDDANDKWSAYSGTAWSTPTSHTINYFGNVGFGVRYTSMGFGTVGETYLYRGMWTASAEL